MRAGPLPFRSVLVLLFASACGDGSSAEAPALAPPPIEAVPSAPVEPVGAPTEAEGEPGAAATKSAEPEQAPPAAPVTAAPAPPPSQVTATPAPAATPATTASAPVVPAAALPPVATAADYTLDPGKSALYVQVFKETGTVGSGLSHDHVVSATGWSGTVFWDPADPSACKVDITVPVSGLRPDDEATRKRVGYDVMLSADQREEVKSNMLAAGQLDARRFGDIRFAATSCEAAGDKVKVGGKLTVHGVSKPVTSTMKIAGDGKSLVASGTFSAKATDFGFEPYTALLGALKNKNEMKFTIDVRGASK